MLGQCLAKQSLDGLASVKGAVYDVQRRMPVPPGWSCAASCACDLTSTAQSNRVASRVASVTPHAIATYFHTEMLAITGHGKTLRLAL